MTTPETFTHFVELGFASLFLWCLVVQLFGRWLPAGGLRGYIRPLIVLAIVLGMEMTQPRVLEVIAAVGAASALYCLVDA